MTRNAGEEKCPYAITLPTRGREYQRDSFEARRVSIYDCWYERGKKINKRPNQMVTRSFALTRMLSLFNCPQAAMISRPRGVRTGEA